MSSHGCNIKGLRVLLSTECDKLFRKSPRLRMLATFCTTEDFCSLAGLGLGLGRDDLSMGKIVAI